MVKNKPWDFLRGAPWWGKVLGVLMYTVFYPVTLLARLVLFGRITDKETPLDRVRDKFLG